ncbi:malonate transporter [Microbulbifer donghaiensis]|uniref:Malonate transporter n=1 Tax=Microbulbifer donghaiensis TaxID=494016 RepID=A0A1M5HDZ7_9GAMM|nr:AEC family transporter [Microbulbifer donghaiensis]SHG14042.1 malonate transporter [Microbulbifer donghaiensis]
MTEVLLNSLVPIFAVMALGYFAGWIRDIDNRHVSELNALVMDFALPASLFVATASTPRSLLLAQWPLLLVFLLSMLVLYALSFWMQRRLFRLGASEAAVQALTIAAPNYAAAGLPLVAAVFGSSDTIYVALAIATGSIVLSPLTLAILEANQVTMGGQMTPAAILQCTGRSLRKPIVLAPLAGMTFSLLGIPLAEPIKDSFQLIGQAAGGVALFLTGLILSAQKIVFSANVLSGTALKNLAHPLLALGLILALPMEHDTARAALLLCALPCGFFGTLFGLRYGLKSHLPGSTLIVSSLASIVTLPIVLVLTEGW